MKMIVDESVRKARIAELEKELAHVMRDIDETARIDQRVGLVESAFAKLKAVMFSTLTPDELAAINGAYIFLHNDGIDLVRSIPDKTSQGEDIALLKDLKIGDELVELDALKEADNEAGQKPI
jgi:hypothetical protein